MALFLKKIQQDIVKSFYYRFIFYPISSHLDPGKVNVIDNSTLCDNVNDRSIGNDDDDDEHDLHDDGVSIQEPF